jgi:hypothetical protein
LLEKAEICHKKRIQVITYDEAADLHKRGALTRFNREIMGFFNKYRALNVTVFICLPVFWHLDSDLFDLGIIHGLIHLYDTQEHYTRWGVYDYSGIGYLRMFADKFKYNRRVAYIRQLPYLRGQVLPLTPERDKILDIISTADKKKSIRKSKKNMDKEG